MGFKLSFCFLEFMFSVDVKIDVGDGYIGFFVFFFVFQYLLVDQFNLFNDFIFISSLVVGVVVYEIFSNLGFVVFDFSIIEVKFVVQGVGSYCLNVVDVDQECFVEFFIQMVCGFCNSFWGCLGGMGVIWGGVFFGILWFIVVVVFGKSVFRRIICYFLFFNI